MDEPLRLAQLAHRLRLRAQTVSHHLETLRMAELVRFKLEAKDERRYGIRPEALKATFAALEMFLIGDEQESNGG